MPKAMHAVLFGLLATSPAATDPPHPGISFEEALAAAEQHPAVLARMARLETREAFDDELAGIAMDPSIQVRPGYRAAAPRGGKDGLDGSISLQQSFSLHDWGGARRSAAQAERIALGHDVDAVLRAARRRAARAWLNTWIRGRAYALRQKLVADAEQLMAQMDRRFELGMGRKLEHAQARAFLAQAELDLLEAEGQLFEAELELAAACGRADGPLFAIGPLPEADLPPDLHETLGIESDPEVRAARASRAAARERQLEAAAQDGWQILTGLNVATEPPGDIISSATLGLTLPVAGRNVRSTSERAAERAAAEHDEDATTLAMRRLRIDAVHEVEHTRSVAETFGEKLLPARRAEVEALERELELGGVPLRRVLDARIRLLEAEIGAASAEGRAHAAAFDLELLIQSDREARS